MPQTGSRPRVVAGLRLVTMVGQGGEGEVWEARDSSGNQRALKLIRPDSLVIPNEVSRRGQWLLAVDHPALVKVHRTGALRGGGLDGWGFVEMDFVEGRSLEQAPADADAMERLAELADGLDALHQGVWSEGTPLVHRDVKPANLIHTPDDRLVLVDHSTLRALDNPNITRIGTPLFVAPEVISGRIGPAADIYSFAVTALALLTGARRDELSALVDRPDALDVPHGLRAALQTDPASRPSSCKAVLDPQAPVVRIEQLDDTASWVGSSAGWGAAVDPQKPPATDVVPLSEHGSDVLAPPPGAVASNTPVSDPQPWHADVAWTAPPPQQQPHAPGYPAAMPLLEPPRLGGWLLCLLVAVGAVAAMPLPFLESEHVLIAGGVAAGAHLLMHILARRSIVAAVLAPPAATGLLLAAKASAAPGRLRDWSRPLLLGAMTVLTLGMVGHVRHLFARYEGLPLVGRIPFEQVPYTDTLGQAQIMTVGGLVLVLLALTAIRSGGVVVRLVCVPPWAVGAVVLIAGGIVLWLPAVVVGRGMDVLRAIRGTVTGIAAFVSPARPF